MKPASETYALLRECPYGILDPLAIETFPDGVSSMPLVPTWLREQASQLPHLIQLAGLEAESMTRLLERFDREAGMHDVPCIGMLVFTDASPATLRGHLIGRMTIRHRGKQALLRYYDARVLLQLSWMLTPGQLAWLFGPINRVAGWVAGEWLVFDKPDAADDPRAPDTAALERIGAINDILAGMESRSDSVQAIALSRRIEQALTRAQARGLQDEDDRIAFATHAVTVHPEFDLHPRIATLLGSLSSDASYRDAARLLDQADWERIRADLHTGNLARIAP